MTDTNALRGKMKDHSHSTIIRKNIVTCATAISLTIIAGSILTSNQTIAEGTTSANAAVTVPFACTMSGTGNNSHNATISPNTYSGASGSEYENGIGKTTLTAICNDDNGFSIYAIGFTGNEYSGENHTKLVGSSTGGTIVTKAYASGDTTSNWSMKLTKVTDTTQSYNPQNLTLTTGYDSWHAVPDTYTKVAEYHANTGSSATDTTLGVKLETTYAAFIAANQPADTYTGQVKYTMVHPYNEQPLQPQTTEAGCIRYYPNGSNVIGTMGCQPVSNTATSIMLLASNFSRTGYGFAGWSDSFDYATNPNAKFYGPHESITFTAGQYTGSNPGLSLYAIWVKSEGSIQDQSKVASVCNSLATAPTDGTANLTSVSALTDQRDNETYAIAKLADGKCWMIENLRLESAAEHNSDGTLAQGYSTSTTYGNFGGLANAESSNFSNTTTANSLYYSGIQSGTASINIGTSNYPGYRMPRYNNINTPVNSADRPQNPTSNISTSNTAPGMYSYGNYYTWSAAIANLNYYASSTGTDDKGKTSETANTSLCPTGWRLPYGSNTGNGNSPGGFYYLNYKTNNNSNVTNATASHKLRSYPYNFLCAGDYDTGTYYRGSNGFYWSSTAGTINYGYAYNLFLDSTTVSPSTTNNRSFGASVRCVADF